MNYHLFVPTQAIRQSLFLFLSIVTPQPSPVDAAKPLAAGPGRFEFPHDGRTIPVWYFLPDKGTKHSPVLVVMHGVKRDAERYRDEWLPYAEKYGAILVAPEFSDADFPGTTNYSLDPKGAPAFIEPLFDTVKAATGNRSERYLLYGHSAGAQFVHRFLYYVPEARVEKAVAANAGWWTLPDPGMNFPYGLKGSSISEGAVKTMLQRPLVILLGTEDTDTEHINLNRSPEAMAQGPHRFARGLQFLETGKARAEALGVTLGWRLGTAPGVGHDNGGMAAYAVRWLFAPPPIRSRDPAAARVLFGGDTGTGESYQEQYAREGGVNILVTESEVATLP